LTPSRTSLVAGDPERNWLVLWSRLAGMPGVLPLAGVGKTAMLPSQPVAFGYQDDGGVLRAVRPAAGRGGRQLHAGRGRPLPPLTVTADVVSKPATDPAGRSAGPVLAAIRAGNLDVTLAPGLHEWDATIPVPANLRLTGYGATVKRLPTNNLGTNWPSLWVQGRTSP
jgi:hypothetical protein